MIQNQGSNQSQKHTIDAILSDSSDSDVQLLVEVLEVESTIEKQTTTFIEEEQSTPTFLCSFAKIKIMSLNQLYHVYQILLQLLLKHRRIIIHGEMNF